jgi:hypothetical protein
MSFRQTGKYRISNDCSLIIASGDSESLFIRQDTPIREDSPLFTLIHDGFIKKVSENKKFIGKVGGINIPICDSSLYDEYQFMRELKESAPEPDTENDCLHFAEFLAAETSGISQVKGRSIFPYQYEESVLGSIYGTIFGESNEGNMEMLDTIPDEEKNDFAVPKEGEVYAIIRKGYKEGDTISPYHIAFVIYSHEGLNITLEAAALPEGDPRQSVLPQFSFYDTVPRGRTFHKKMVKVYFDGETIVLQTRDPAILIKQITKEITKKNRNTRRSKSFKKGGRCDSRISKSRSNRKKNFY